MSNSNPGIPSVAVPAQFFRLLAHAAPARKKIQKCSPAAHCSCDIASLYGLFHALESPDCKPLGSSNCFAVAYRIMFECSCCHSRGASTIHIHPLPYFHQPWAARTTLTQPFQLGQGDSSPAPHSAAQKSSSIQGDSAATTADLPWTNIPWGAQVWPGTHMRSPPQSHTFHAVHPTASECPTHRTHGAAGNVSTIAIRGSAICRTITIMCQTRRQMQTRHQARHHRKTTSRRWATWTTTMQDLPMTISRRCPTWTTTMQDLAMTTSRSCRTWSMTMQHLAMTTSRRRPTWSMTMQHVARTTSRRRPTWSMTMQCSQG